MAINESVGEIMSIFSLFKRKKEEDFSFPTNPIAAPFQKGDESQRQDFSSPLEPSFGQQPSQPSFSQPSFSQPAFDQQPSFTPQQPSSFSQMQGFGNDRDIRKGLELLSSKLDTIKALLDAMNQRLANLERNNQEKDKKETVRW